MAERMHKRRISRRPQGHSHVESAPEGRRRRIARTVFWLGAALLMLAAVLSYDRTAVKEGQGYVETAEDFAERSMYDDAVVYYERAFDNKRLSRAKKAEIAVAVADIQFERFKDYEKADVWYHKAKNLYPAAVEQPAIKQRLSEAARLVESGAARSAGAAAESATKHYVVRFVQLIAQPATDREGPVLASYQDGAVHAGQVARALKDLPPEKERAMRADPAQLAEFVRGLLEKDLLYRAAVDAGYDRDPEVAARLFDYQRSLIAQRYAGELKKQIQTVPNEKVEAYYRENRAAYFQPGKAALAMIKTDSLGRAQEASEKLAASAPFGDVATSYSLDAASARTQGVVGLVKDTDTSIPGVGVAPHVVKDLLRLPAESVTSPTQVNDAWFVFKVIQNMQPKVVTLDQARPEIERTLRARQNAESRERAADLTKRYGARLDETKLPAFWDYVDNPAGAAGVNEAEETTATAREGGGV